jgi:hypothetical protein
MVNLLSEGYFFAFDLANSLEINLRAGERESRDEITAAQEMRLPRGLLFRRRN